jgi:hypothetical protein
MYTLKSYLISPYFYFDYISRSNFLKNNSAKIVFYNSFDLNGSIMHEKK